MSKLGSRIRVLVVDDSALMRRVICGLLEEDPDLQVIGTANDGMDAIQKVQDLKPDVVTMDIEMPKLDGLQALGFLMAEHPTPCVMLSAYTPRGADITLRALDYGATDFVQKPSGSISLNLERVKEELIAKIKVAAGVDLKRLPFLARTESVTAGLSELLGRPTMASAPQHRDRVIAIACSTGGPRALAEVLPRLPKGLAMPVLVVQHMSAGFTKSLANRLDRESQIRVKEAEANETLEPGIAYLAPGDWHMQVVAQGDAAKIALNQSPPLLGVRPCADLLFASVAELYGNKALGVILTGMGRDGVKGLKLMKAQGAVVLAQDEASSVVWGMPRAAHNAGIVDALLPLELIAGAIVERLP